MPDSPRAGEMYWSAALKRKVFALRRRPTPRGCLLRCHRGGIDLSGPVHVRGKNILSLASWCPLDPGQVSAVCAVRVQSLLGNEDLGSMNRIYERDLATALLSLSDHIASLTRNHISSSYGDKLRIVVVGTGRERASK